MAIAPLSSRLMEDRLRTLEMRLAVLERRVPTGDALTWSPTIISSGGVGTTRLAHNAVGTYVRMNNILFAWLSFAWTSGPAGAWSPQAFSVSLPYPVTSPVNGTWTLKRVVTGDDRYLTGPVVLAAPGNTVYLRQETTSRMNLTMDNTGIYEFDHDASITAGLASATKYTWQLGGQFDVLVVGRIPDGS